MRIKQPSKIALKGFPILLAFLRSQQEKGQQSALFAGTTPQEREAIHAAIDWIWLVTKTEDQEDNS